MSCSARLSTLNKNLWEMHQHFFLCVYEQHVGGGGGEHYVGGGGGGGGFCYILVKCADCIKTLFQFYESWVPGYKTFYILNSVEFEI